MSKRKITGAFRVAIQLSLVAAASAQSDSGRRQELEQSLESRYRVTVIGQGLMGIRKDPNALRRAGGVLVLRREGLWGSFDRNQNPSWAIRGDQVELLAGHKDVELQPGEKFYISGVSVGSDVVAVGLLTARTVSGGGRSGRLWLTAGFFFDPQILTQGDIGKVYSVLDQWLAEEGGAGTTVAQSAPHAEIPPSPSPNPSPSPPKHAELKAGMPRDQLLSALGAPLSEVSFEKRTWLTYPGLVATLEEDRLVSVDRSMQAPARVSVRSEPTGAEVLLDGKFIGTTPDYLQLAPGTYTLSLRLQGYEEWRRELYVISGSETGVQAKLEALATK